MNLLDGLLHDGGDNGVVFPGLEAAVDDEGGGEDAQEDDCAPDDPGDRGSSLGPKICSVNCG